MKGFIIHLPKSNLSKNIALEAKTELENISIDTSLFIGCDRYNVWQEFIDNKFVINDITRFGGGYVDSEIATFISHYKLWKRCVRLKHKILIFEHDVKLFKNFDIKEINKFKGDLLNLGKPNWGNRVWDGSGIIKREICSNNHNLYRPQDGECQCNSQWLFGAHAYLITPSGAKKLINSVKENGILPADLFLRQEVLDIYDYLPHPFIQKESFSLIQRNPIYKNQKVNEWDY